ncbi:MAG TPA: NAD(P)-dependent oxidoreductase, partial [Burkholderiales bacterium]|nr:NAD(P)-dependent oxidoreductase [Burkholderiales bacterium]
MARHLLEAGHEVALWSHTSQKARELAGQGKGKFCETPRQVAEHAECMFLCVGDTAMSQQAVLGAGGIIEGAKRDSVVVDASTVSPSASRAMGEKLREKGVHFLDAPCTGSKPGAEGGTLTFMIGGDKAVFEHVRPF